ncbi:hypothetical protein DBV15_01093 [Temnothorax longispinosus]|uniref:Uncharacterized protein n=1 Tax=Temnothorax longispinosus TaxID=300112 RepID=A0A4V6RG10_9HYME|nr:hypothetical protein DBV15_01093 [Temnothorax longispinosus]
MKYVCGSQASVRYGHARRSVFAGKQQMREKYRTKYGFMIDVIAEGLRVLLREAVGVRAWVSDSLILVRQVDAEVTLSAYIYISRQSCRNPVLTVIESDDRSSPTYPRKPPSRWTIARSCTTGTHMRGLQITTFLNADRDVDLSGAKTTDAVSSRHRLLPFDNRVCERASLSPCLNSECGETRSDINAPPRMGGLDRGTYKQVARIQGSHHSPSLFRARIDNPESGTPSLPYRECHTISHLQYKLVVGRSSVLNGRSARKEVKFNEDRALSVTNRARSRSQPVCANVCARPCSQQYAAAECDLNEDLCRDAREGTRALGVAPLLRVHAASGRWRSGHRLPCLPRLIDRGATSATESILVSARRPFFAPRRRKFVCRCLNTPAVRRVDGDPSRDTFGQVDEFLISHTSIRRFAIFTTAPLARQRQAIRNNIEIFFLPRSSLKETGQSRHKDHIGCASFRRLWGLIDSPMTLTESHTTFASVRRSTSVYGTMREYAHAMLTARSPGGSSPPRHDDGRGSRGGPRSVTSSVSVVEVSTLAFGETREQTMVRPPESRVHLPSKLESRSKDFTSALIIRGHPTPRLRDAREIGPPRGVRGSPRTFSGNGTIRATAPWEREPSVRRLGLKLTESTLLAGARQVCPATRRGEGSQGEKEREARSDVVERETRAKEGCGALTNVSPPTGPPGAHGLRPLSLLLGSSLLCARDATWGKGTGRGWRALLYLRGVIEAIQQY